MQEEEIKARQQRRIAKAREREQSERRARHGAAILRTLCELLGDHFTNSALDEIARPLPKLAPRIEQNTGLVAAYVSRARARQLLTCCQGALGVTIRADLVLEEKSYMGLFSYDGLSLPALVALAERLEDRIFVTPLTRPGLLVIDYYAQKWTKNESDFSIIVQGKDLESAVKNCFA